MVKYYAIITDVKDGRRVTIGAWDEKELEKDVKKVLRGAQTISGIFDKSAWVNYYTVNY